MGVLRRSSGGFFIVGYVALNGIDEVSVDCSAMTLDIDDWRCCADADINP